MDLISLRLPFSQLKNFTLRLLRCGLLFHSVVLQISLFLSNRHVLPIQHSIQTNALIEISVEEFFILQLDFRLASSSSASSLPPELNLVDLFHHPESGRLEAEQAFFQLLLETMITCFLLLSSITRSSADEGDTPCCCRLLPLLAA